MATKAPAYEEKIKRAIRDAFAYDPLITQNALIEQLNQQFDHSFDFRYIRRLTVFGVPKALLSAYPGTDHPTDAGHQ